MSEMVERVIYAMRQKMVETGSNFSSSHDAFELLARAAIEAMRSPTDTMIDAAMAPYLYGNDEKMNAAFCSTIKEYWQAMIKAAVS